MRTSSKGWWIELLAALATALLAGLGARWAVRRGKERRS